MARPRIVIIGLGLVGASMGLAIRKAKPEIEVVGHDASNDATKQALKLGAIEKSEWNLLNACESADVLILAVPALAVKEIMQLAGAYLQKAQVVTDTAGSKSDVMQFAKKLLPDHVAFVGGDPMVGSADAQATPRADLFQGVTYCLCPTPTAPPEAIQIVVGLVELLGATPYFVDPLEHDGLIGVADHLSFVLSAALLRMVATPGEPTRIMPDVHRLIGPTFRRAAGFSSADPQTFRDLCLTNRDALVRWIGEMRVSLDELSALVQAGDQKKLESFFNDVYATRYVVNKPYRDPDQEAQADTIRASGSFGFTELFMGRRRLSNKSKADDAKKAK